MEETPTRVLQPVYPKQNVRGEEDDDDDDDDDDNHDDDGNLSYMELGKLSRVCVDVSNSATNSYVKDIGVL